MCRMYGHLSAAPVTAAGMLVDERHALIRQSCGDWRGESHGDGWGIGYYDADRPVVVRHPTAASEDARYRDTARRVVSRAVVGHVRQASVGDRSIANTHPFAFGRWIFAHNGTVTGFDRLMAGLDAETDADLRRQIGGTTDSEHVFFWLLSRLQRIGEAAEGPCREPIAAAQEIAAAIRTLDERSAETRPDAPARLNFLLTDGRILIASRWRHSLYWTNRHGPFVQTVAADRPAPSRGVAIASESIGDEPWAEVPEGCVMTVDADFVVHWTPI